MEQILQKAIPSSMIQRVKSQIANGTQPRARKRKHAVQTRSRRSPSEQDVEFFLDIEEEKTKWPKNASSKESIEHVRKQSQLSKLMTGQPNLLDLCRKCLTYDQSERITARNALQHDFLKSNELRVRYLRKGIDVLAGKDET